LVGQTGDDCVIGFYADVTPFAVSDWFILTGDDCVIGFCAVRDWFIMTGDDCVIGFSAGVALCAVSDWFILTGGHCVIGFCAGVARCAQTRRTVQSRRLMKTTLRTTPVRTQPMNGRRSCVYLISDTCQL